MVLILTGRFHVAIDEVYICTSTISYSGSHIGLTAQYAKLLLVSANQHAPDSLRLGNEDGPWDQRMR